MKVSRESYLFLAYSLLFLLLTFLISTKALNISTISNYRLSFNHLEIAKLTQDLERGSLEKKLSTPDDPGFILFYAVSQYLKGDSDIDHQSTSDTFPFTLKIFFTLFHLLVIYFLTKASPTVLSNGSKIAALIFLLTPTFLSVFLAYDVYVFPLYASILGIYSFGKLSDNKLDLMKASLISALVGICEIFRIYSFFLVLPFMSALILRKKFVLAAVSIISFLLVTSSMGLIFSHKGHTAWHSLHTGLFEFGGCINGKGDALPYSIFTPEEAKEKGADHCIGIWSDSLEYQISLRHGVKDFYSPAYDQILKTQYLDFIKNYPVEMASLTIIKFFDALNFLPIKETSPTGHYINQSPLNMLEGILFLVIFLFWLYKGADSQRKLFYATLFLFALPSPVLIHSQHIIYNIPLHFIQIIIIMECFRAAIPLKPRVQTL